MANTKRAEFITYTDNELAAIKVLEANRGNHLPAKDLGIATAVLTSLSKKAVDPRPMAEGVERVMINKEDKEVEVVSTKTVKAYWID